MNNLIIFAPRKQRIMCSKHEIEVPCSYDEEELYEIVKERLHSLEHDSTSLVDGEEVFSQIRARYGFKA